jgi:hypothetical protein
MWVDGLAWAFWERKTPLWQVEHLPVMPAWFMVAGDQETKPLTWQESHCAVVGMCTFGFDCALAKL